MDDILDEIITENQDQTYSWVSFVCGCLSIFGFVLISYQTSVVDLENLTGKTPFFVLVLFVMTAIVGILSFLICYVKNEPYNWQRQLGAVLNLFLIALLFGVIYYTLILN